MAILELGWVMPHSGFWAWLSGGISYFLAKPYSHKLLHVLDYKRGEYCYHPQKKIRILWLHFYTENPTILRWWWRVESGRGVLYWVGILDNHIDIVHMEGENKNKLINFCQTQVQVVKLGVDFVFPFLATVFRTFCHNPKDNTTQQNLNTVVGLDTKMTVQTPPHPTTHTQH